MRRALLCIGNRLCGDDGVALFVGELVEKRLGSEWRVFYGEDVPENEFGAIREFAPELLVVCDAMSGFREGGVEFLDLQNERDYIFSTHNLPVPVLLTYLRSFCKNVIFLGVEVLLENMLDVSEELSSGAKNAAQKAFEKVEWLTQK